MAITVNDLKLFESEMMTNFSDGGGAMTNNVVIDGASNNIFPDVTEQSRVYGHVEERKVFMGVRSQNNDAIYAAMSYISKLPKDTKINVNLAKSNAWSDERGNRVVKEKTSIETTVYPVVSHPAATTTTPAVVVNRDISAMTTWFYRADFPVQYGMGYLTNQQSFECYISQANSGSSEIIVFGTDGCYGSITTESNNLCGVEKISRFLKNKFLLKNVISGNSEMIDVYLASIISYVDAETADYIERENGQGTYSRPLKKWRAILYISSSLEHTYTGATINDSTTWVGSRSLTKMNAIITPPITVTTPAYTTQDPNKLETITGKKFYTTKKITAQVNTGATAIPIANNSNVIIPTVDGLYLDDEILGANQTSFTGAKRKKEIFDFYQADVVYQLPKQNLISVTVYQYFSDADIAPEKLEIDKSAGTIRFKSSAIDMASYLSKKVKITYEFYDALMAFNVGDVVNVLNDSSQTGTFANSALISFPETNLSKVTVHDAANNLVDTSRFIVDLNDGWLTFVNVSGLSQPLTVTRRIEDLGLVKAVSDTTITLQNAITHTYPVEGTVVANCLLHGTLQSTATRPFDQQTWTNVWQSTPIGSTVSAEYNFTNYPISVLNLSAITERWLILFKSATTFDLIGENLGLIANNGSTSTDLAPINPYTSQPYFVLPAAGFGGGWSAGNCLRFDTTASAAPFWVLQTISQGQATDPDFDFAIEIRGEIDAA